MIMKVKKKKFCNVIKPGGKREREGMTVKNRNYCQSIK